MKYIDEFRDKDIVRGLIRSIEQASAGRVNLMEVCGTHTMAIFRSGIKQLLPPSINLISGPGCPVCVTSQTDIDRMLWCARLKNVIVTTFGDMLKVPGSSGSLEKERAGGSDIRPVYSPLDALDIAKQNPRREIVFLAVGFETTAPVIASIVSDARDKKLKNFSVYCCHKTIPPAMKALLEAKEIKIDGFLCPGHVSSIIGARPYDFISREFNIPCVVSGFEPIDILETVLMLLNQKKQGAACVEIQYRRAVTVNGNAKAQEMLGEVFSPADAQWRGLGTIGGSGLALKKEFKPFDAADKFDIPSIQTSEPKNCMCGQVLRGVKTPQQCSLFAKACTPENPYGPCMVSTEGTCSAWYKYGRKQLA